MSRPNFRIIEGDDDFSDIYEDFKRDYLSSSMTVKMMLEKYDLTYGKYNRLRKEVAEETGVNVKRPHNFKGGRWNHETAFIDHLKGSNKYWVRRFYNGSLNNYGTYKDLKTAIYVRDTLIKNNWSQECYENLRWELFGEEIVSKQSIEEIYDEFKVDFMEGHSLKYLMAKYDLNISRYETLSKLIRCEEGILRKPQMSYKQIKQYEKEIGAV